MSKTTGEVSHVAAGEHMVPGPFHYVTYVISIHEILPRKCGIPRFWSPKSGPEFRTELQ
jgi:hypothetical protein